MELEAVSRMYKRESAEEEKEKEKSKKDGEDNRVCGTYCVPE